MIDQAEVGTVIAVISLVISFLALIYARRADQRQKFDYQLRLELNDIGFKAPWFLENGVKFHELGNTDLSGDDATIWTPAKSDPAFIYIGELVNRGDKTIYISTVTLDIGDRNDIDRRSKLVILQEFYLIPNTPHDIRVALTLGDVEDARGKHNIEYSEYLIRVTCYNAIDERVEYERFLATDRPHSFVSSGGNRLRPVE
jgi:hypothetical protein